MINTSNSLSIIGDITQPYITARRFFFFVLVVSTVFYLSAKFVSVIGVNGFNFLDLILTFLFIICLPWTVVGFWNGIIGFCIMQMSSDAVSAVTPFLLPSPILSEHPHSQGEREATIHSFDIITTSTALLFCIRNEDVDAVFDNINAMVTGLAATEFAQHFHVYILSDTTDMLIAEAEEKRIRELELQFADKIKITYRLRETNAGFKAGNIRDFCDRWGVNHDFFIPLDADSFMSTRAILILVRMMQAHSRVGILQHLTVGLPSHSAFTRIFQFGMRLGMRSYTVGSAWWQADCGPYWGHNAIIRTMPFIEHCTLPQIVGTGALSGDILSHDQIEAVMMRRAGYECRIYPVEDGSFEENPPSILEFLRRDLRWCQGNMQYLKLLGLKRLKPTSRYQLLFAIGMFIGAPATLIFWIIIALRLLISGTETLFFDPAEAKNLVFMYMFMGFVPKIATLAHVMLNKELSAKFGGRLKVGIGAILETIFSFLLVPVAAASEAIFLFRLVFGKVIGWGAHKRGVHQLSFEDALHKLLPHTLIGIAFAVAFGSLGTTAFWWTLPMNLGLILCIPFAMITTNFKFGQVLKYTGLCATPEEIDSSSCLIDVLKGRLHDT